MLGMIGSLYSYKTAPKATFFLKHPGKAIAARRTWSRMTGDTARNIALGVGAAAIMVPLGVWLGSRAMS